MEQTTRKEVEQQRVKALYERIQYILDSLELKWMDLAALIGVSPKTLSSMKAQNVNPSYTTLLKIAAALDVSLDELANTDGKKSDHYYELCWMLPKAFETREALDNGCIFLYQLINFTTTGPDGKRNIEQEAIRDNGRRRYTMDRLRERLKEIEKAEEAADES